MKVFFSLSFSFLLFFPFLFLVSRIGLWSLWACGATNTEKLPYFLGKWLFKFKWTNLKFKLPWFTVKKLEEIGAKLKTTSTILDNGKECTFMRS